jgi:F-type H+-transporting ATPase subunit b
MAQLAVLVAEKVVRKNLSDDKAQMELIDKLLDEVSVDK